MDGCSRLTVMITLSLDIEKPYKELYNFIRACDYNDYPAHFYVDGKKVLIKLTRENKPKDEKDLI